MYWLDFPARRVFRYAGIDVRCDVSNAKSFLTSTTSLPVDDKTIARHSQCAWEGWGSVWKVIFEQGIECKIIWISLSFDQNLWHLTTSCLRNHCRLPEELTTHNAEILDQTISKYKRFCVRDITSKIFCISMSSIKVFGIRASHVRNLWHSNLRMQNPLSLAAPRHRPGSCATPAVSQNFWGARFKWGNTANNEL